MSFAGAMYDSTSAVDPRVRELADQMAGVPAAQLPPGLGGQPLHLGVQLLARDVGRVGEEPLAGGEGLRQVVPQPVLDRVVAEDEGPPEVGLVLLEDRPEVGEHDVVRTDHPVRRVLPVRLERVRPGPHDPLVPVPGGAEQFVREIPDAVADRPLPGPRHHQAAPVDLREQPNGLRLCVQQPCRTRGFVVIRHGGERTFPSPSRQSDKSGPPGAFEAGAAESSPEGRTAPGW
ncbi:hypothetical protein JCM4814A_38350 [Streptomyces phaeofaciens JCM 4814]